MKLVIWDFDGPLFESRKARDAAFRRLIGEFPKLPVPQLLIEATPLYGPRNLIYLAYAGEAPEALTTLEQRLRELLREEEAKVGISREVEETLVRLSELNCRQAILSLRSVLGVEGLLQRLQIRKYFDFVRGRDDLPAPKPHPATIEDLLQQAGVDRAETVMVGDSAVDLQAARAAKIHYVHAGWSDEPIGGLFTGICIASSPRDVELLAIDSIPIQSTEKIRVELRQRASERPFSFFAGAGVSIPSGIGAWKETYLPILSKYLPHGAIAKMSLPEAVELVCVDAKDGGELFDEFKKLFRISREPNPYHYAMVRSRADTIWTTNYDMFFELAKAATKSSELNIIRNDTELKDCFGQSRKMIKVNGDFDSARFDKASMDWNLILSDEQFDISEAQRQEIWRYFEDEFRTSSIVFIGVSFADPTLKRVLSIVSRRVMRTRGRHYMLALRPSQLQDTVTMRRQIELLKRREIHPILFDSFSEMSSYVCELAVRSRRPMIGFSGRTHKLDLSGTGSVAYIGETLLADGQLTIRQITTLSAMLGAQLARGGFRVGSSHGVGVGLPAVEDAHAARRHAGRFIVRKKGDTPTSRGAPVITHGEDLQSARELLITASALLVAMGGGDGTVDEVRQAIDRGRPVLLVPQAGGTVCRDHEKLLRRVERMHDEPLRDAVIAANRKIAAIAAEALPGYLEKEFCPMVMGLVQQLATSAVSHVFEESCGKADEIW